jgi:hypothetical protein
MRGSRGSLAYRAAAGGDHPRSMASAWHLPGRTFSRHHGRCGNTRRVAARDRLRASTDLRVDSDSGSPDAPGDDGHSPEQKLAVLILRGATQPPVGSCLAPMAAPGHFDPFPPSRLNGRYPLSLPTSAGASGNGRTRPSQKGSLRTPSYVAGGPPYLAKERVCNDNSAPDGSADHPNMIARIKPTAQNKSPASVPRLAEMRGSTLL